MHLFDASKSFMGGYAIVAGHMPLACGLALAEQYKGTDRIAVNFLGDGAVNEGEFHEALNLAASGSCRCSSSARTTSTAWAPTFGACPP